MIRLRLLQGLAGVEAFLAFRSEVNHSILAVVLMVSIAALYGGQWRAILGRFQEQWERFALQGGHTPWLATLLGVGLPMLLVALLNGRSIATFDNYGIQLTAASLVLEGSPEFSRLAGARAESGVDCGLHT